ncbi:MAG TPA: PAS domain S-box protein [Methanobacteriaceae archaeon]|nr:PAS domain S-box protein [Methanobacteriaceae archaeon]
MPGFKVLLAEDESITALQIKNKLKSWDFDVVAVASSGEEAIEMALEKKPDIVILDIILKGNLDGIDAAEKIKDVLNIPIIYLTAFTDENTMNRAMSTEPKNYILKPFDDNELRFALEMSVYRNKIENELKKTQNYLELITENMVDIVGQVDTKGVFLYVSPSIKKLLGYQPVQILGNSIFEFVHPEDLEMTLNCFNRCMETGKPEKIRKRVKTSSGDYKWIETMGSPVYDDSNQINGAVISCRDIGDQINIEDELKSALNYSRNLIEVSLDPMVTISENGEIMDVNSATEDSTGLSRKDLVGTDFSQYFTNPEKAMKGYQKTLFYGSLKDYSLTLRHISGRTMDVSFNASVYRNRAGEVEGIFAAARNITKLKKANNALKLSERHFRSLIENALDVIMVLNHQGDITYASPSVEKVFGYKVHEFLGFNIFDFIHYKDSPRLNDALTDDIRSSGSNVDFEVRCQHENGQWLSCQMVAQNLIKDPAVRGIVLNIRDITPRKQAERARSDLEEMYSTLITASPDGFIATDLEGKISYVSEKAAFMMGWSDGQKLVSETIFDILVPEEKELFGKNMELVMNNGALRNIEHKASKKDGETFVAEMNMALTQDSDGNPKGLIVTIRDVTYRKNMEKKIKSSLKEKEILLKEVHHRVKNNMQVISSLIGLQSEKVHDKKTREMFEDSKNRIRSMALIHEKLYGSEGMEKVDFSEYVKSLTYSLEKSYSDKINVDIMVDVEDVLMDIDQAITCGLILNELISNSLKYAFPEQTVLDNYSQKIYELDKNDQNDLESSEIPLNKVSNSPLIMPFENPLISVAVCSRGEDVIMYVADNGVGLPDGLKFKETESLGLQIVCTLVAQLEGEINLKETNGTKFVIKFKEIDSN